MVTSGAQGRHGRRGRQDEVAFPDQPALRVHVKPLAGVDGDRAVGHFLTSEQDRHYDELATGLLAEKDLTHPPIEHVAQPGGHRHRLEMEEQVSGAGAYAQDRSDGLQ